MYRQSQSFVNTFKSSEIVGDYRSQLNFNIPNSEYYPTIKYRNNTSWWSRKTANYPYVIKGHTWRHSGDVTEIVSGLYGAKININHGLKRYYGNYTFTWNLREYFGSHDKPKGLELDDGSFAELYFYTVNVDDVNDAFRNVDINFALVNRNDQTPSNTIFSADGSYGIYLKRYIFRSAQNYINQINREIQAKKQKINTFTIKNLYVDIQFYLENPPYRHKINWFPDNQKNELTYFKFITKFDLEYTAKKNITKHQENLAQIKKIKDSFKKTFKNNYLEISTDTGEINGISNLTVSSRDKSNKYYFEKALSNWWSNLKPTLKTDFALKYELSSVRKKDDYFDLFVSFQEPDFNQNVYKYVIKNVNIRYKSTEFFKSKNLQERIKIVPGKTIDKTNFSNKLVDDVPVREENDRPISREYGGTWIYDSNVKVIFNTTLKEDEILYINEEKVDVINQKFEFDLKLINLDNPAEIYKIKVVKFDKENANFENKKMIAQWEMIIKIKNNQPKMEIKWFGWQPDSNPQQRSKIEEYLKNDKSEFIFDEIGQKMKNPDYDKLIDPATGTKNELVWIDFSANSLPNGTQFLQDPQSAEGNLIKDIDLFDLGIIAQASVIEKGANFKSFSSNSLFRRFKVRNDIDNFDFDYDPLIFPLSRRGHNFKISQIEENYFSSEGIWLFSYKNPRSMNLFKIIWVGKNKNNQLFSEIFPNTKIYNFWESTHGQHLAAYLGEKENYNLDQIKQLSYDQVILKWKDYINDFIWNNQDRTTYKNKQIFSINTEEVANTIRQIQKKNQAKRNISNSNTSSSNASQSNNDQQNSANSSVNNSNDANSNNVEHNEFANNEILNTEDSTWTQEEKKKLLNNIIINNKNTDNQEIKIIEDFEIPGLYEIQISNSKELNVNDGNFQNEFITLDSPLDSEAKENKEEIIPHVDIKAIKNLAQKTTFQKFVYNDIEKFILFENKDNTNWNIKYDSKFLLFVFSLRPEFKNGFYIEPKNKLIKVDLHFQEETKVSNQDSNKNNIFDNFNLTQLNINGLFSKDEILSFLEKNIQEQINTDFELDKDYFIENKEIKLNEIEEVLVKDKNFLNNWVYLKVKDAQNASNFKVIKAVNKVENQYYQNQELDLKTIQLKDLIIDYEQTKEYQFLTIIKDSLISQLIDFKLVLETDLNFKHLETSLEMLKTFKNEFVKFVLYSQQLNIKNELIFKVKLINFNDKAKLDFAKIIIDDLSITQNSEDKIIEEIRKWVSSKLKSFNLELDKDYYVSSLKEKDFLATLLKEKDAKNVLNIKLEAKPDSKKLKGETQFYVFNKITNLSNVEQIKINNQDNKQNNLVWIIPLSIIISPVAIFVILKLFRKYLSAKRFK
ncbi:Mbov_0399 family ICE element protein [Mesomycoplasma hyorhinis]|uniref:Mbov_0399 family ICE element protein n=1 Tax=Mesomycoplasma hyorhinis TaxID=2100 RepID=UPI001C04CB8C|nr:peptidase [Mesomycoplasma hyorhinis]